MKNNTEITHWQDTKKGQQITKERGIKDKKNKTKQNQGNKTQVKKGDDEEESDKKKRQNEENKDENPDPEMEELEKKFGRRNRGKSTKPNQKFQKKKNQNKKKQNSKENSRENSSNNLKLDEKQKSTDIDDKDLDKLLKKFMGTGESDLSFHLSSDDEEIDENEIEEKIEKFRKEKEEKIKEEEKGKKKGGVFGFFKSLASDSELTRKDLVPVVDKFRLHLITKNVPSEIAQKICESIIVNLEGKKIGKFTRTVAVVKEAIEDSIMKILTPKKDINILKNIEESKTKGVPYTIVFCGVNGVGKCLAKNTPILLYNGSIQNVQDIKQGSLIMGDDSTPRKVISTTKGKSEMFKITHSDGRFYIVNNQHILTLQNKQGKTIDISIQDYLKKSTFWKQQYFGFTVPVDFQKQQIQINPYSFALWIAGKKTLNKDFLNRNKFIPNELKFNTRKIRMEFLSGLIDSIGKREVIKDGEKEKAYYELDFGSENKTLRNDVEFICNSLGLKTQREETENLIILEEEMEKIEKAGKSRNCCSNETDKNQGVHLYNFAVESIGEDEYFGFTLDGNGRFILGNFIVTHNSTSLAKIAFWLQQKKYSIIIAAGDTFRSGAVEQLRVHAKCLNIPLFERGYRKDPVNVAAAAIRKAQSENIDVVLVDTTGRMQDNETQMRALVRLVEVNNPDLLLFVGEALVGNDGVDQLVQFNRCLADYSNLPNPRLIDGILLTKFDTIDDKVGAALSMVYTSGQPIVFVGVGQTYPDLKKMDAKVVCKLLTKI
ncbi:intein-containing signal recognition particle receptor subunit alpha precursor [Anaeramoeba ignava]|uniref:Intein-containing signal recognition particle receptor subunit alpha n=1 Tax=Anaeramoeba ignava TaxID=1746090 RepID=A0A9Q0LIN9_ANAIG|nr:intein-containing signal recognition particle receptor subunit alpha precursor [Anaeramoeba ignava]